MIGNTSYRDFKSIVSNNMIQKFPIAASGVPNYHTLFGPNLAGTRGKTVWHNLDRALMGYISVPKYFLKLHKFVTLVADVMFVNGATFLITMSRGIKFVTVEHIPARTDKQLSKY